MFNSTYKQNGSILDNIKAIQNVKDSIIKFYNKKAKIVELLPPLFAIEDDPKNMRNIEISRPVTLDLSSSKKVVSLYNSHSNWMRSIINRTNIDGAYCSSFTITRDSEETQTSTTYDQELIFQFRIPENEEYSFIAKKWSLELYELIYNIAKSYGKELPEKIDFNTAQELENEFSSFSFEGRENKMALLYKAFILSNPGNRLYSKKYHRIIDPLTYDLKKQHEIIIKDEVNQSPIRVATISIMSSGKQLSDQISMSGLDQFKSFDFYDNLIKQDDKIIELKINIPKLVFVILDKGHICEVQPGIVSDESDIIVSRYKIEKY